MDKPIDHTYEAFVRCSDGSALAVPFNEKDKVLVFKKHIAEKYCKVKNEPIDISEMLLIFCGNILPDKNPVGMYKLHTESAIHLVRRPGKNDSSFKEKFSKDKVGSVEQDLKFLWSVNYTKIKDNLFSNESSEVMASAGDDVASAFSSLKKRAKSEHQDQVAYLALTVVDRAVFDKLQPVEVPKKYRPEEGEMKSYITSDQAFPIKTLMVVLPNPDKGFEIIQTPDPEIRNSAIYQKKLNQLVNHLSKDKPKEKEITVNASGNQVNLKANCFNAMKDAINAEIDLNTPNEGETQALQDLQSGLKNFINLISPCKKIPIERGADATIENILIALLNASRALVDSCITDEQIIQAAKAHVNTRLNELESQAKKPEIDKKEGKHYEPAAPQHPTSQGQVGTPIYPDQVAVKHSEYVPNDTLALILIKTLKEKNLLTHASEKMVRTLAKENLKVLSDALKKPRLEAILTPQYAIALQGEKESQLALAIDEMFAQGLFLLSISKEEAGRSVLMLVLTLKNFLIKFFKKNAEERAENQEAFKNEFLTALQTSLTSLENQLQDQGQAWNNIKAISGKIKSVMKQDIKPNSLNRINLGKEEGSEAKIGTPVTYHSHTENNLSGLKLIDIEGESSKGIPVKFSTSINKLHPKIINKLEKKNLLNNANKEIISKLTDIKHCEALLGGLDEFNNQQTFEPSSLDAFLWNNKEDKELMELNQRIEEMFAYGLFLLSRNEKDDAVPVFNLALKLKKSLKDFFSLKPDEQFDNRKTFKEAFKTLLHSEDNALKKHRAYWKIIVANIAIAFTGVGLFALGICFAVTGHILFKQTQRENLRDKIEKSKYLQEPEAIDPALGKSW